MQGHRVSNSERMADFALPAVRFRQASGETDATYASSATPRSKPDEFLKRGAESLLLPVPNPFSNAAAWTPYEVLKALLVLCTIFPMRLTCLFWCLIAEVFILRIATKGTELIEDRGCFLHALPFPWWRKLMMYPCGILNRCSMFAMGYWPGGIRVNDYRKDKKKRANLLVVAPHMTFLDSLMIAVAFPPIPSGVGYTGLLRLPVMKWLSLAGQVIFVDRLNSDSRQSCKDAIKARASPDWTGPPVMIFPEGTTTNGDVLIQFKLGAFSTGQPVVPVCLRYGWKHYNPGWVGKNSNLGAAILRTMLQFANYCDIDILDVYVPCEEEKQDPKLYANNVRKKMAFHLRVPFTEHSYDDAFLAAESKALMGTDFEAAASKGLYKFTYEDLKMLLKSFEQFDQSRSGAISKADFLKAFQSSALSTGASEQNFDREIASVEHLFTFFDQDDSGHIEYREFVQAVALLSTTCHGVSRAKLAFLLYDVKGTGKVQRGLLRKAIDDAVAHSDQDDDDGCQSPGRNLLYGKAPRGAAGGADEEEIGFQEFSEMVESQPEILEVALGMARERLGISDMGREAASTSDKKDR